MRPRRDAPAGKEQATANAGATILSALCRAGLATGAAAPAAGRACWRRLHTEHSGFVCVAQNPQPPAQGMGFAGDGGADGSDMAKCLRRGEEAKRGWGMGRKETYRLSE